MSPLKFETHSMSDKNGFPEGHSFFFQLSVGKSESEIRKNVRLTFIFLSFLLKFRLFCMQDFKYLAGFIFGIQKVH